MTKSRIFGIRSLEAGVASNHAVDPDEKARLRRLATVLHRLQIRAAAQSLKQRYGSHPFYAERAAQNVNYWRDLAYSAVNA